MDLSKLIYRSQGLLLLEIQIPSPSYQANLSSTQEQLHMRSLAEISLGEAGTQFSLPGSLTAM